MQNSIFNNFSPYYPPIWAMPIWTFLASLTTLSHPRRSAFRVPFVSYLWVPFVSYMCVPFLCRSMGDTAVASSLPHSCADKTSLGHNRWHSLETPSFNQSYWDCIANFPLTPWSQDEGGSKIRWVWTEAISACNGNPKNCIDKVKEKESDIQTF